MQATLRHHGFQSYAFPSNVPNLLVPQGELIVVLNKVSTAELEEKLRQRRKGNSEIDQQRKGNTAPGLKSMSSEVVMQN